MIPLHHSATDRFAIEIITSPIWPERRTIFGAFDVAHCPDQLPPTLAIMILQSLTRPSNHGCQIRSPAPNRQLRFLAGFLIAWLRYLVHLGRCRRFAVLRTHHVKHSIEVLPKSLHPEAIMRHSLDRAHVL